MGLDMYLRDNSDETIGYWRKHPNLHGYIVNTFADCVDECQRIELTIDNVRDILKVTIEDRLPTTNGFFFGTSQAEHRFETIEIFDRVLQDMQDDESYRVYYQASW